MARSRTAFRVQGPVRVGERCESGPQDLPAARHKDVGGEVHAGEHERAVQKGERRVVLRVVVVEPLGLQPHRVREDDLIRVTNRALTTSTDIRIVAGAAVRLRKHIIENSIPLYILL